MKILRASLDFLVSVLARGDEFKSCAPRALRSREAKGSASLRSNVVIHAGTRFRINMHSLNRFGNYASQYIINVARVSNAHS